MKQFKRITCLLLAVVLTLGTVPATVRAEETVPEATVVETTLTITEPAEEPTVTFTEPTEEPDASTEAETVPIEETSAPAEEPIEAEMVENASQEAAYAIASGTCGDNVTWMLDSEGVMTVSGIGPIWDYSSGGIVAWRDDISSVVIDAGVTAIGNGAFRSCWSLSSVEIPNTVTSIGSDAFWDCNLTSITIPDSVIAIGDEAFANNPLTSIRIPASVTSIGSSVFAGCSELMSIWVSEENLYYSNDNNGVLFDKDKVTLIQCPHRVVGNYAIPEGVVAINNSAFHSCSGLSEVTIPNSVTTIGDFAFCGCDGLDSLIIPNTVTNIGNHAFFHVII